MTATLIFGLLCVGGLVFLIKFLTALLREGKRRSRSQIIYLTLPDRGIRHNSSRLATMAGGTFRRHRDDRPQFKTITGGRVPTSRRAG